MYSKMISLIQCDDQYCHTLCVSTEARHLSVLKRGNMGIEGNEMEVELLSGYHGTSAQ